jgi:hypothetical protein
LASGTFYPAASGDDGYKKLTTLYLSTNFVKVGNDGHPCSLFVRFPNATIPAGAIVTQAYIRFTASANNNGNTLKNIYFNAVDDAVAPTNYSEFDALSLTSGIAWDSVPGWTKDSSYDTVDIKTILQDIVDRVGWVSGQAVMAVIKDDGSGTYALCQPYSYDNGSSYAELHVEWDDPAIELVTSSPYHTHTSGSPALTQKHTLTAQGAYHTHAVESPKLVVNLLKNVSAYHAHVVGSPVLTQKHVLTVQGAYHLHVPGAITLTQKHSLTVNGAYHTHAVDSIGTLLWVVPASTYHAHVVGSPVINFSIIPASAYHTHVVGSPALTQKHNLTVASPYHLHVAGGPAIQWVGWLAAYGSVATKKYYCTLTGDGETPAVADVTLPMSSFQARRKSGDPTYLSVVVPGTAYQTSIEARTNGEMVISCTYEYAGVSNTAEIFRADYEYYTLHEGGKNQSIILTGHKTETFTAQSKTLLDVTYKRDDDGDLAFRCATIDPFLQPGDTATYDTDTFTVGQIVMAVSTEGTTMEVQESET